MVWDFNPYSMQSRNVLSKGVVELVVLRLSGLGKKQGWKGGGTEGGDFLESYYQDKSPVS